MARVMRCPHLISSTSSSRGRCIRRCSSSSSSPSSSSDSEWWTSVRRGRVEKRAESEKLLASLSPPPRLSHLRVVLVDPNHPGNVGAVARACANFECPNLYVVKPDCDWDGEDAVQRAAGDTFVLHNARCVDTLDEALDGCVGSIALTRRHGRQRLVHESIGKLSEEHPGVLLGSGAADKSSIALVFGRESSGLTDAEVQRCGIACEIPTGRLLPSLNLASAVSLALADCFSILGDDTALEDTTGGRERASDPSIEALVRRLEGILEKMDEVDLPGGPAWKSFKQKQLLRMSRSLFGRACATQEEVDAFHGFLRDMNILLELGVTEKKKEKIQQRKNTC